MELATSSQRQLLFVLTKKRGDCRSRRGRGGRHPEKEERSDRNTKRRRLAQQNRGRKTVHAAGLASWLKGQHHTEASHFLGVGRAGHAGWTQRVPHAVPHHLLCRRCQAALPYEPMCPSFHCHHINKSPPVPDSPSRTPSHHQAVLPAPSIRRPSARRHLSML